MSTYANLDAHSRNCSSCIRQRDTTSTTSAKKYSLPCRNQPESTAKIRRSTSSLSYADIDYCKENSFEGSTYLTPTQRKNSEIKKLRAELAKAKATIHSRDGEIISLRDELVKLKGDLLSPDSCEANSIPDSGNCDEDLEQDHEQNIDFELMESTLREEEETRHQLSSHNQELQFQLETLGQELEDLKVAHRKLKDVKGNRVNVGYLQVNHDELEDLKVNQQELKDLKSNHEESTLREEEARLQLASHNQELQFQLETLGQELEHLKVAYRKLEDLKGNQVKLENHPVGHEEMEDLKFNHEEQIHTLQQTFNQQLEKVKFENNRKFEEVLTELSESSLRFSRQQKSLETKQERVEEQSRLVSDLRSQVVDLKGQVDAAERLKQLQDKLINDMELKINMKINSESSAISSNNEIITLQKQLYSSYEQVSKLKSELLNLSSTNKLSEREYLKPNNLLDTPAQTISVMTVDKVNQTELEAVEAVLPRQEQGQDQQLSVAVTYQFLRRSIYYFLTDKDNKEYHLNSIQRLLHFSAGERQIIDQHEPPKKY